MVTTEAPRADAVVIGGGIIGSSIALHLAAAGQSVVLVERSGGPVEASTRNGGGVRAQCRNRAERLLAMRSQILWRELQRATGVDFEYTVAGNARLAFTEETLDQLRAEQREEREDGLVTEVWGRARVAAELPFLSPDVVGAKFCAADGHANPILATWTIVGAARIHGVRYLVDTKAEAIGTKGGVVESVLVSHKGGSQEVIRAPLVVHAAGAWSRTLAKGLGIDLPLVPARNAMMITESLPPLFDAFISSHDKQVYLRQARKGHVHIGGVFDVPGTFDQSVETDELEKLARAVDLVPALADARVLRSWAGTLDNTPDHKPLVGPVEGLPGYVIAAGFSGHGFCLGPVIGESIADLVLGRPAQVDLSDLAPARFEVLA